MQGYLLYHWYFRLFKHNTLNFNEPAAGKKIQPQKAQRYEVKAGDTLYSIAKKFNIQTTELADANRISDTQLHAGQILTIPAPLQ